MSTDSDDGGGGELPDEQADALLDQLAARADERDDIDLRPASKRKLSRRSFLGGVGVAGIAGLSLASQNAEAQTGDWSNATGQAGTQDKPYTDVWGQHGHFQEVSAAEIDTTGMDGARFGPGPTRRVYDYLSTGWEEVSANPIITNDTNYGAIGPSIIKWPFDNHYSLYWDDHGSNIQLATADEITGPYTQQGTVLDVGATGEWDEGHVGSAEAVYYPLDTTNPCRLYYHGGGGGGGQQTGVAYGTDGQNWTKKAANPVVQAESGTWRNQHTGYARFIRYGGENILFHRGKEDPGTGVSTGISWSIDDESFDQQDSTGGDIPQDPLFSPEAGTWHAGQVLGLTPIRVGGTWYGFLSAQKTTDGVRAIGLYSSDDLINWTPHPANPIIDDAGSGGWNDGGVAAPSFIRVGTTLYMFVEGDDGTTSPAFSIGAYKLDLTQLEVWK